MSETKHTPGPWKIFEGSMVWAQLTEDCTISIAHVYPDENAHLIAAAPDLYDDLYDWYAQHGCHCDTPGCKRCRATTETRELLARARGET